MGYFDYSREPKSDIAFVDMKSFYASVECVERGLHPLMTSLCVMSRADNSNGLILASSPKFKEVFGKSNVGRSYDLPLIFIHGNFLITTQNAKGYQQHQNMLDLSKNGLKIRLSYRLEWTYTLRRT